MKSGSFTKLYCFSPPVMMATLLIEFGLAAYFLCRYKLNSTGRVIFSILVCLGVFQLAEFFVCGGYGMSSYSWSVVGYIAITLLPPLGMNLVSVAAKGAYRAAVFFSYAAGVVVMGYLLFISDAIQAFCNGNYVIFHLQSPWSLVYGAYYLGILFLSLMIAINMWRKGGRSSQESLRWYVLGVLSFLVPVAVVVTVAPQAANGVPSIMCGFAIVFAGIVAARISPLLGLKR